MFIDKNYKIATDNTHGVILIFQEEKETINKEGDKIQKIFEERYYFPSVQTALKKYVSLALEPSEDVKDCLVKLEEAMERISKLKV